MTLSVLSGNSVPSLAVRMIQIQNGNKGDENAVYISGECTQNYHLPRILAGDRPPLSLLISSSTSLPSKHRPLLFTLTSELALLLVARGESETLIALLRPGPDLTLYIEDAGMFVINGRKLPGMLRLISICLIAISRDFFESVLPKPELSGDEDDFPERLP